MNAQTSTITGCGSSTCQCAGGSGDKAAAVPNINGISLHEQGQHFDASTLREMAYAELLRQTAVKAGLLPRLTGLVAPELGEAERGGGAGRDPWLQARHLICISLITAH